MQEQTPKLSNVFPLKTLIQPQFVKRLVLENIFVNRIEFYELQINAHIQYCHSLLVHKIKWEIPPTRADAISRLICDVRNFYPQYKTDSKGRIVKFETFSKEKLLLIKEIHEILATKYLKEVKEESNWRERVV